MSSFIFLNPLLLWLLLPVIFWSFWANFRWKALPSLRVKHAFIDRFLTKALLPEKKTRRWLWLLSALLIVIALGEPVWQTSDEQQPISSQQANGMIVLEASVNMLLQENNGNTRLQQAQSFLSDLLAKRSNLGRTGLTVFADEAYPVVPLTQDSSLLENMISRLEPALAGREDSALLEAIQFSGWSLSQSIPDEFSQSMQKEQSSWLLLITDGAHASTRGDLDSLIDWLKRHHVHLYVLMLGQHQAPEQVSAHSLLYVPRNMALAERLSAIGLSITMIENVKDVSALINLLTQASNTQSVMQTVTRQQQSLSAYFILFALCCWLALWWQDWRR